MKSRIVVPFTGICLSLAVGCSKDTRDPDLFGDTSADASSGGVSSGADGTGTGADTSADGTGGDTADGTGGDTADGTGGDSAGDDAGDGGPLLDVSPEEGDGTGGDGTSDEGCSFVDLLFVIDNSVSMGGYQAGLGQAFPQFADTLVAALPPGTNVHVGVTSSEMGYASGGSSSVSNGVCTFTGDGMPSDNFYVTPDVMNTGKNGAQGRLFDPGGGQYFVSFDTDASATEIDAVKQWFNGAAAIGTGGSNIEMTTAPAGWAFDPANDATNAGFLRDEGAVLVVFFMQDEPDQTPMMIGGQSGGQAMLDKVALAKAGCGGLDCVLAGGFLDEQACSAQGNLPLDDFLEGMAEIPSVQQLPNDNLPAATMAQEMNALLSDTLADVIAQKCDEIPPVD